MGKWLKVICCTILVLLTFWFRSTPVLSQTCDNLCEVNKKIDEYQKELSRLSTQANTLSNQIAQFNAQIRLTEAKIKQTEEKILLLGGRIDQLELSLGSLTDAFSSRAVETYKMTRFGDRLFLAFSGHDLSEIVSRFRYLQKIQEADRGLLVRLQKAQNAYTAEKTDQEELADDLEEQTQVLGAQKSAKASLLTATRSDEKRYQELLAKALAEIEAIQSIIAGKGQETEAGSIGAGQRIASIIPGSSTCSDGGHLHFEVAKDKVHQNPASYLSSKNLASSCSSGIACWDNAPDGPFGFGGSWPWPINDPVRITQGYGMTYYASQLKYYGGAPHTGIDMVNNSGPDWTVKSVQPGTLYRGAIGCKGGTLRYVHVRQNDGYDTYYLHVNY